MSQTEEYLGGSRMIYAYVKFLDIADEELSYKVMDIDETAKLGEISKNPSGYLGFYARENSVIYTIELQEICEFMKEIVHEPN